MAVCVSHETTGSGTAISVRASWQWVEGVGLRDAGVLRLDYSEQNYPLLTTALCASLVRAIRHLDTYRKGPPILVHIETWGSALIHIPDVVHVMPGTRLMETCIPIRYLTLVLNATIFRAHGRLGAIQRNPSTLLMCDMYGFAGILIRKIVHDQPACVPCVPCTPW